MPKRPTTTRGPRCRRGHPQNALWSPRAGCARCNAEEAKRPPPPKRCAKGHRHSQAWRPAHGCTECRVEEQRRFEAEAAVREREVWSQLNPVPAVLTMRVVDTGRIIRHSIPRHLQKRKARGPRRRRRI